MMNKPEMIYNSRQSAMFLCAQSMLEFAVFAYGKHSYRLFKALKLKAQTVQSSKRTISGG